VLIGYVTGEILGATFRIAIVGSGPAGLSAAARAAQLGISHVLLEKTDHLSDTIYKYQKGKHVMATPSQLVLRSDLDFEAGKREAVLGTWDTQASAHKMNIMLKAEVKSIAGAKGNFTLTMANGESLQAENVILAIGTQGNPNKMRCDGANLPHIQYQLDDPGEYVDEHITVVGSGDAGIENALGLAADPEQGNVVTILNRGADFARAKSANVKLLMEARDNGRMNVLTETSPTLVEPGYLTIDTRDGQQKIRCDRIIARMGSAAPRAFIESCGIEFTSADREAFPKLLPSFESTAAGIYVIGALAGYPLIKHCMNQGYDVVEFINGNRSLKPADEPILEAKFRNLPGGKSVEEWLEFLRSNVTILNELSPLQMREFMLDSDVSFYRAGTIVFERNDPGSSLFAIASGSVAVHISAADPSITIPIATGSIFGEVGLISGRRRGATIRTAEDSILVEVSRTAALKLMASVPAAKRAVNRISTERQLLQMFGSGLTPDDLVEVLETAEVKRVSAGEAIIDEGRGRLRHLRHPPGLDGGGEEYRRQAGFPLLSPRRILRRRDGADRRREAHRDSAGGGQIRGDQAQWRCVPPAAGAKAEPDGEGQAGHGVASGAHQLRRSQEGRLQRRGGHVFIGRKLPRRERDRRSNRRASHRRASVRRLRQLRESLRGQP
jgi:thioredoxin reductase/CRP-like cAMP-binding protein